MSHKNCQSSFINHNEGGEKFCVAYIKEWDNTKQMFIACIARISDLEQILDNDSNIFYSDFGYNY